MNKRVAFTAFATGLTILGMLLLGVTPASAIPVTMDRISAAPATYYVDAVSGSDMNAGTSSASPWKSLDKINSTSLGAGDRVLLKAGATWNNQFLDLTGSGTSTLPIVVDRYGRGANPVIDFGGTSVASEGFGVRITDGSYWNVQNLDITSGQQPTGIERTGIVIVGDGATPGTLHHIHIVNNDIHDVFGSTRFSGGITVWAKADSAGQTLNSFDDILIEGNTVRNVADRGIQAMTDKVSYGNKDNVPDSWYTFTHLVIRGNTVSQTNGDGILPRGALNSLIELNSTDLVGLATVADSTVTAYLYPHPYVAAQWAYYCKGATFQRNVASRTKKIRGDGEPWDFDIGVFDSVYQYNYSYDNEGGTLLSMYNTSGNVFRYNISQNDGDATSGAIAVNRSNGGSGSVRIYNNDFYRTEGQTKPLTAAGVSSSRPMYYLNNIFWGNGSFATGSSVFYSHNTFYGANSSTPSDPAKLTTNPSFANPGGATNRESANAYALTSTSPARDSGIATASENGGLDFVGHEIYQGSAPDRGAIEFIAGSSNTPLLDEEFDHGDVNAWSVISGSWHTDASPSSFGPVMSSGYSIAVAGSSSWRDYSVSERVAIENPKGNAGLLFRYNDPANYYMLRINANTNSVDVYQTVNGTLSLLASSPFTPNIGTFYSLRADVRGNLISAYLDGASVAPALSTPSGQLPSGKVGLRTAAAAAQYDNVLVTGSTPDQLAQLSDLSVDGLTLNPAFASERQSSDSPYTVTQKLDSSVSSIHLNWTLGWPGQRVRLNGEELPPGATDATVAVRPGRNTIELTAGSFAGDSGTYVIKLTRDLADFTSLAAAIADVEALDDTRYSADTWSPLMAAQNAGTKVMANKSASQVEVNAASAAIAAAKAALIPAVQTLSATPAKEAFPAGADAAGSALLYGTRADGSTVSLSEADVIVSGWYSTTSGPVPVTFTVRSGLAATGSTAVKAVATFVFAPAWSAATAYSASSKVVYEDTLWFATWWSRKQTPGDPSGPWQQVRIAPDGTRIWTASGIFNSGDVVIFLGQRYKADYWTRNQAPGDAKGPWEQIASTGDGTALWTASRIFNSGDIASYEGKLYAATWWNRNEVPTAADGPWKLVN